MRAAVVTKGEFRVEDLPAPVPGSGQVLVNVTRNGICGTDLHARVHCDELADLAAATGYDRFMRSGQSVVMGHEFTGEVAAYGPNTRRRWKPGTPVVALPYLRNGRQPELIGFSTAGPGGYAEQVLVQEAMTFAVPNGLSPDLAGLTEPMAIAWHAVRRGRVGKGETALVIGCGPIGLAIIIMLKAAGVRTVVASDFSPRRRELAARCGADVVVDPGVESPWAASPKKPQFGGAEDILNFAFDTTERLRRLRNIPWWYVFRAAYTFNAGPSGPVVFECVGVPGILDQVMAAAPPMSRVVVVGLCIQSDTIRPGMAVNKQLELRFALAYDPGEFRDTLHMIADGKVDPSPLHTGTIGLDGIDVAYAALSSPERHAKILIDPRSSATALPE